MRQRDVQKNYLDEAKRCREKIIQMRQKDVQKNYLDEAKRCTEKLFR